MSQMSFPTSFLLDISNITNLLFNMDTAIAALICFVLFASYLLIGQIVTYHVKKQEGLDEDSDPEYRYDLGEKIVLLRQIKVVMLVFLNLFFWGFLIWRMVAGTSMQGHVLEWLNLLIRWVHLIAGIAWIGASFYFIFLENSLNRTENLREGIAGDLWAIHGGGCYILEKFKVAPPKLPKVLHWFKYEAYFTWITGVGLLFVVYYFNAEAYMVDPMVRELTGAQSVLIGIGSLIVSWLVYDLMCRSPLIPRVC